MDYKSQTLLDLKTMCRDRGLKVSGTKDEVIIRLMENDEANQAPRATITPVQTGTVVQGATYTPQQMVNPAAYNQTFKVKDPVDGASSAIGTLLIIYGILRALWALFFTAIGAGAFIWNPIALIIAAGFVLGGSLMARGYKNGIYISLVNTCDFWSVEFNLPSKYLGRSNCNISSYDWGPDVIDIDDVFNYFYWNCCLASTLSIRSAQRRLS